MKKKKIDDHYEEFVNILANQDLVDDIGDYSIENFYKDICNILKKDKYLKDTSLLKTV